MVRTVRKVATLKLSIVVALKKKKKKEKKSCGLPHGPISDDDQLAHIKKKYLADEKESKKKITEV